MRRRQPHACRLAHSISQADATCPLRRLEAQSLLGTVEQRGSDFLLALFCVIDHALEVDEHHRLVSDYPSIVSRRNVYDVTCFRSLFCAVIHPCRHGSRELVAEMGGLATVRLGDRLDAGRPLPAGLERGAADCSSGDLHKLDLTLVKLPHLLRRIHALQFEFPSIHLFPPFMTEIATDRKSVASGNLRD